MKHSSLSHFFSPSFLSDFFLTPSLLEENAADEAELSTVCYRPEGLDRLVEQTNFSRKELQVLYRGFKNVSQRLL